MKHKYVLGFSIKTFIIVFLVIATFIAIAFLSTNAPKPAGVPDKPVSEKDSTSTPQINPSKPITLKPTSVYLNNGKEFSLNIPQNYTLRVAAQGFRHARFMAFAPDGRLFLGDLTGANDAATGKIYVLDNFNEQSGTFTSQKVYIDNLRNPNSVAFYTDENNVSWIYVALTDKIIRYTYIAGQNTPGSAAQTITTLAGTPSHVANGYWHFTRTLAIHNNILYVSIGSSCNSCEQTDSNRAVILQMNPDGSNQKTIASGLRNAVGITFVGNDIYATANEVDNLGNDKPDDVLYKIVPGTNYGWPYCYQSGSKIYSDTSQKWNKIFDCNSVPVSWSAFTPHSAPLGLVYIHDNFSDPALRNSFLVALHGASKTDTPSGNSVVMVKEGTSPIDIISGFLQNGKRLGRPVDVIVMDSDSFFVTDDANGVVYYVKHQPK